MTDEFWRREGLRHLTPAGKENPEGWDVWSFLGDLAVGSVVEIGCGTGRLCRAFPPDRYLGTDINPAALARAAEAHPDYSFELYAGQSGDTALLYTVLLHIRDEDLPGFVSKIRADRVILAEVMGRKWRRKGNPPVFNREPEEYVSALQDYSCIRYDKPYLHYRDTNITFLVFDR